MNHSSPVPLTQDAEVGTVAAHRGDHARPFDIADRVHDRLAHDHRDIQEELIVTAHERERLREGGAVGDGLRQSGCYGAQQQTGTTDIALMHLIAHGQSARDNIL